MPSIEIDGEIYQVKEGANLLEAVLSLGMDLPYFCWHPSMGSVGACRQCAVIQYQDRHDEQDGDKRDHTGRIVMSCMTPVSEGMRVSVSAETAREFRADIIGMLMENHPHDCPVCEEGGECHLQDMTVMTGHTVRDYRGKKRTHRNQYLGPFINHEMNRCIACYRCVRFYGDYAGGSDLQALAAHNHVYFGRHEDGALENEFSGNLVEVCPTGVFTDKTLSSHYNRKWDLQTSPSVCVHCAHGCNVSPGERYGYLRRIVNRYNSQVNGYFICDRGRFGYDFVNRDDRVRHAVQYKQQESGARLADALSRTETRDLLALWVAQDRQLIGIGSPRASLESNYALRELVGRENFYAGVSARQAELMHCVADALKSLPLQTPGLDEIEQADAVLILGEDVANTAPRVALAVRQAARNEAMDIADELRIPRWQDAAVREAAQDARSPIFIASIAATRLDDIAAATFHATPAIIAKLGNAVAHLIDASAPRAEGLSANEIELAGKIAQTLKAAKRPLVISGTGCFSKAIVRSAANIGLALARINSNASAAHTYLYYALPECNSMGLALLTEDIAQQHLTAVLQRLETTDKDDVTAIVLETDLARQLAPAQMEALSKKGTFIVLDHRMHAGAAAADLVLPAAPFTEAQGTLVSAQGRAQRFFPTYAPSEDVRASWEWLSDMVALRQGQTQPPWEHPDDLMQACGDAITALSAAVQAAPDKDFRVAGMKIARMPHRYSGRTAMLADVRVAEPKQPVDPDSALAFTMEGFPGEKPAALTPYYWSPGWNSNQSVNKFQDEVGEQLRGGDPGIRLIEAQQSVDATWYEPVEDGLGASVADTFLLLPLYHIFGSEELSSLSDAIRQRVPDPYLVLHPDDAKQLSLSSGDGVVLSAPFRRISIEVQVDPAAHPGAVLAPYGLSKTAGLEFMRSVSLHKDPDWQPPLKPQIIVTDTAAGGFYGEQS